MIRYKLVAVDTEPTSLKVIEDFLEHAGRVEFWRSFQCIPELKEFLSQNKVDILVTDVQLHSQCGIELVKSLPREIKVIFSTAHSEFAVNGFEINAVDYLLKPYSKGRFMQSIDRAVKLLDLERTMSKNRTITVSVNYVKHHLPYDEILFVESVDDYIRIWLANGEMLMVRKTLKDFATELADLTFARVHRSYLINRRFVVSWNRNTIALGEHLIPVGFTYKSDLEKLLV